MVLEIVSLDSDLVHNILSQIYRGGGADIKSNGPE